MRHGYPWILRSAMAGLASLAWLIASSGAIGQVAPAGQPVDQAVGDLDPLSRSLRPMEPGIAQFDPRGRLRELDPAYLGRSIPGLTQRYVYSAPGVRAYVQRPDYLVAAPGGSVGRNISRSAGRAVMPMVSANTVFDLTPGPAAQVSSTVQSNWVDHRLDTRLGPLGTGRVYGQRINTRLTPMTTSVTPRAAWPTRTPLPDAANPNAQPHVPRQVPIESIFPSTKPDQPHKVDPHSEK